MSCSSHLPPRRQIQNKGLTLGSTSWSAEGDNALRTENDGFPFEGSFFEDQTLWLDDLFISSNPSKGISLQSSASDPFALLASSSTIHSPVYILEVKEMHFQPQKGARQNVMLRQLVYMVQTPHSKRMN